MKQILSALLISTLLTSLTFADDAPANSDVALEDSFDRAELCKGWHSTTGEWEIVDGVLQEREIPEEKHSAATRKLLVTQNAVYQLKFRLNGECKAIPLRLRSGQRRTGEEGPSVFCDHNTRLVGDFETL